MEKNDIFFGLSILRPINHTRYEVIIRTNMDNVIGIKKISHFLCAHTFIMQDWSTCIIYRIRVW